MGNGRQLQRSCLFCRPEVHGLADQVLLRSDHFFLLAGPDPIIEGYLILAPHRCDQPDQPLQSFADLSPTLLDEVAFLRGLISEFYRDLYRQEASMHFECGRMEQLHPVSGSTSRADHAYLCCYPRSLLLWEDLPGIKVEEIEGLPDLPRAVGDRPYLLIQSSSIDQTLPPDSALRERWTSMIALIEPSSPVSVQHLQQLLKFRLGEAELSEQDPTARVNKLISNFQDWLRSATKYELETDPDGHMRLNYLKSVEQSNRIGNNSVAQDYHRTWAGKLNYGALGRFLSQLPERKLERLRILDIGCGPGHYVKVFHVLGFESIGIDVSEEMTGIARQVIGTTAAGSESAGDTPLPQVETASLYDLRFTDNSLDGIWCNAVVVHVPRRLLPASLACLHRMLKQDGVLFLSALLGNGSVVRREGRVFFYYGSEELENFFDHVGFKTVSRWSNEIDLSSRGGQRSKAWVNFLLQKKAMATAAG